MFDDALVDGFDERVVGDGLCEDLSFVVLWRCGDIELQGEAAVFLS